MIGFKQEEHTLITINPFSELAEFIPSIAMQAFVVAMIILVIVGTVVDMIHKKADIYHRAACEKLLDSLSKEEQIKAEKSALSTAKYLWNFLTGMSIKHNIPSQIAAQF